MKYKYTQDKKRQFISITIAMLYWYGSSIFTKTTKTFLKVPVFITNISNESFIYDIDEDGKMLQHVTLVLKGNKEKLKRVEQEKLKVLVNLKEQKKSYISIRIQSENIYYDNKKISEITDIENIFFPEVILKIEKKIRKEIPVIVKVPKNLENNVAGIFPNSLIQVIDGTKKQIENQESSGLLWEIPEKLIHIIQKQNENNSCIEKSQNLYIPKPDRTIKIPAIEQESFQISDPQIDKMQIFMMPCKNNLIQITTNLLVDPTIAHLFKIRYLKSPRVKINLKNISNMFAASARNHIYVQICIKNNKAELELGVTNINKLEKTFISLFLKENTYDIDNQEELKKIAKKYFYYYINSMEMSLEDENLLLSEVNIYGKTISINT